MTIDELKINKIVKVKCLHSLLFQTRYFYKLRFGRKFIVNEHHEIICDALEKVLKGEITRLIINIAPRYSKTELAVKSFIAHGLSLNATARFIHLTYSSKLALDNSEETKDIVMSEAYQQLFPSVQIKRDSKAKDKWYTTTGGGVYAAAAGGQVTGFGAGKVDEEPDQENATLNTDDIDEFINAIEEKEGFAGAIIIDDPIKPEDAYSEVKRRRINERFETTIRSRVNSRKTPIIVIQQRVHKRDLSGYLMDIEPGEWEVIKLPCLKPDGTALWPLKHTVEELHKLKRINEGVFNAQYEQEPDEVVKGGEFLFNFNYRKHVKSVPYTKDLPIFISLDSNVYPYISVTCWQIIKEDGYKTRVRQVHEILGIDPDNTAGKTGRKIANWLKLLNYNEAVFLNGDRSTKNRNNIDDNKRSFFQIINETLINEGFRTIDKILNAPPTVSSIGEFVNALLSGELEFAEIEINKTCQFSIDDYRNTKKDENGNILKINVPHETIEGVMFQKNGHLTDTFKDFIVQNFNTEFKTFLSRHSNLKPGGISQPRKQSRVTF